MSSTSPGVIGPVVRAALPELSADSQDQAQRADRHRRSPEAVDDLLRRISDAGLNATHILINREGRWHQPPTVDRRRGRRPTACDGPTKTAPRQS